MSKKTFIRIHYLRDQQTIKPKANGGFTRGVPVGCLMTYLNRESDNIIYAFAISHPKDHFNRETALTIVGGRLKKNPIIIKGIPTTGHEITKKIINDIIERAEDRTSFEVSEEIPHRLYKMAKAWLKRQPFALKADDLPRPIKKSETETAKCIACGVNPREYGGTGGRCSQCQHEGRWPVGMEIIPTNSRHPLLTFQHSGNLKPTLADAAVKLHVPMNDLDETYGVVLIERGEGSGYAIYSVRPYPTQKVSNTIDTTHMTIKEIQASITERA